MASISRPAGNSIPKAQREDGNKQHLSTSQETMMDLLGQLSSLVASTLLDELRATGITEDVEEISTKYWDYVAEDIFNIWKRMESHPEFTDHSVFVMPMEDMLRKLLEVTLKIHQLYPSIPTQVIENLKFTIIVFMTEEPEKVFQANEIRNILTREPQLEALRKACSLMDLSNLEFAKQQYIYFWFSAVVCFYDKNIGRITQSFICLKSLRILELLKSRICLVQKSSNGGEQLERYLNQQNTDQSTTVLTSPHAPRSASSNAPPEDNKTLEEKTNGEESSSYLADKQKLAKNANPERYSTHISLRDSQVSYPSDSLPPVQEILFDVFMDIQDSTGNTALHSVIEAQEDVELVLKTVQGAAECLEAKNEDDLTPLNLAFQKKLWVQAHALAERQIQTRKDCVLLQEYFFRAMREQGGVDFLPHLLDLRERYFPNLNLNFNCDTGGRTPWWYLANSNDISVMVRVLQALKDHSIDLMQLLTHTERQTRLVEEAAGKNRVLFTALQKVVGHSSEVNQDMVNENETSLCSDETLSQISSCSIPSSFEDLVSIQSELGEPYKMSSSQRHHMSSNKNRVLFTKSNKIAAGGDKDGTSSDVTGTLSRATSCSSISTISFSDQSI